MAEKTKLITQLRDAKNLIEQLEQDKVTKKFSLNSEVFEDCLKLKRSDFMVLEAGFSHLMRLVYVLTSK